MDLQTALMFTLENLYKYSTLGKVISMSYQVDEFDSMYCPSSHQSKVYTNIKKFNVQMQTGEADSGLFAIVLRLLCPMEYIREHIFLIRH